MTFILSIDPGKMTGVALFEAPSWDDAPALMYTAELEQFETCAYVERFLDENYEYTELVLERFKISDVDANWSLEIIGTVRYLAAKRGLTITLQTPADAKGFVTNEMLQGLGYWHVGGAGHANDAIRHGVLYMVRKSNAMKKLAAKAVLNQ